MVSKEAEVTIPEYLREAVTRLLGDVTYLRRKVEEIKTLLSDVRDADEYCHDCPLCPGTTMDVWVVIGKDEDWTGVDSVHCSRVDAEDRLSTLRALIPRSS